ncbi:MAG: HEAT repeat domain-containing protein [Gemmataceae bacterium]|nr:HEAT repeat domain-containing protein [Gemmataceae bacterium]
MRRPLCLVALGLVLTQIPSPSAAAPPPPAPAEFAQPQSPTKPPPFPIKMVDQGKYDPQLKGYSLPDGFRLEVVLDAPDVVNPVGLTFAPDGSLFVLEWAPDPVAGERWNAVLETFRYKDGTTRAVTTMKKFVMDPVKLFLPDPATGKYGRGRTIIAEELPSSILWHDGWLYVTGRGTVRRWRQAPPTGLTTGVDPSKPAAPTDPWNVREVVAQGFCGFHHHQVSGLSIGNDGLLYLTSGDDDNYGEGSDGSRATVLRTGAVFRCRPDGSKLEAYSLGYRNPYRDLAHDDHFNWFHADNDNEDGSKFMGCRIMHVAEGADFGWRLRYGARCCQPDAARVSVAGEVPGKLPPMVKTGRGSPAGLLIPHDTRIPEQYRGLLYYPDVYRKLVRAYKTTPAGSSFQITNEFEFFKSDDPLFRPCQMVLGPDGAIYVCDWRTDSGGAGRLFGDGVHGRVYRIRWAGTDDTPGLPLRGLDSWAKILKLETEKLVDVLSAPDLTDRVEARKELVRRGAKGRDAVLRRFVSGKIDGPGRLPALGVLQAHWSADVEDLFRLLLSDESADVRRVVVEALGSHATSNDPRTAEGLLRLLADPDPAVRRAAALALGRRNVPGAADALANALRFDAQADAFLKDAYVRGLEALGKPGIDALLTWANSGDKEFARAAEVFVTLRTKPAAEALPQLLANPHATPAMREALVTSYNNYQFDPPLSLDPLADFLAKRPDEPANVAAAVVEVFAAAGGGLDSPKATVLVLGLLDRADPAVRLAAIRAVDATRLTAAAPKLVEMLAAPDRPADERLAVVKALRVLNRKDAAGTVAAILTGSNPAALKVEALRTVAALDPAAARKAAEPLLDQADAALQAEAVVVLGATKPGARLVGERFVAKKLPRDLFPQVTDALKKFAADPEVAQLQAEVVRGGLLLTLDPRQAEKVRQQVVEKGNAKRGRELFLNTKLLSCATCHKMEGVGGAVGPDLTRVWDTHTVEKILESIADPGKEIKEGYQTYRVTTADGQVLSGLKVSETGTEVVIRDANGRDVRLAKEDIEGISPTKLSLMPDNTVAPLGYDQFLDLLAFLKSKTEQESLRGVVAAASVAGPFDPDLAADKPEVSADGSAGRWLPIAADPSGALDLKGLFAGGGPAGVYVRAYVYSPAAQQATGAVRADDPVRVWVNGKSAFARPTPAASTAPAEETFTVALKPGYNPVLVKVTNAGTAHRLGLRFAGTEVRAAAVPGGK